MRDQRGLEAHHPPQLATGHADRPHQAELTGALEHRQGERVGDADQGDDDGQRDHHVDHRQHLVDHAARPDARNWSAVSIDAYGYSSASPATSASTSPATAPSANEKASHSASVSMPAASSTLGVEQVVLVEDRLVVEQADDRGVGARAVGDSTVTVSPTPAPIAFASSTDTTTGLATLVSKPPCVDVEVEHGVDLVEVEADDVGDRAVDACFDVA